MVVVADDGGNNPNTFTPTVAQSGRGSCRSAGPIGLSLFNSRATRFLNLELRALEVDGRGRVVSSPRVLTANQVEASIEQGTEIPYQEASSSGATSVSFKKAVLSLKVKPQITPTVACSCRSRSTRDRPLYEQTLLGVPPIETKNVKSEVLIENGGTVVIGGIYEEEGVDRRGQGAGARRRAGAQAICSSRRARCRTARSSSSSSPRASSPTRSRCAESGASADTSGAGIRHGCPPFSSGFPASHA